MSRQGCKSTRGQLQCPQIPTPPHPTTHARAGSQLGPRARRLGLPHGGCSEAAEGQIQTEERVWCEVISAPYCVYSGEHQGQVSVLTWCTHGRGQGRWWLFPGLNLMEYSCPWTVSTSPFCLSLSHTQTRTHSPMFARAWWKRLSADGCLLGPRVLEGGLWGTPMRPFVYLRYKQCLWQRWWYKEANTEFMLCWLYPFFFHSLTFLCKLICIFSFLFLLIWTFLIASGTLIKCQMIESLRHFLCLPFRNLSQHGSRWWQTVLASLQGGWRPLSNQLCLLNQIKKHNHVYWDFQIKSDKAFLFPELKPYYAIAGQHQLLSIISPFKRELNCFHS